MKWHRKLTGADVSVAHSLLNTHTRYIDGHGVERCAGLHGGFKDGPRWPCVRAHWAMDALSAEARGEVTYRDGAE